MKEQFTKAPWKYSHEPDTRMSSADQHEHKILATNDDCEFRVASVNVFDSEDIANAHLIAASPNGFELGLLVMEICGHPSGVSEQQADLLYETALSFIKKARGK